MRLAAELSYAAIGRALEPPASPQAVCHWETDRRTPRADYLDLLDELSTVVDPAAVERHLEAARAS